VNLSLVLFSTVFPTFAVEPVLDVRAYVNGRSIGQSATAFWLGDESGYDGRSPSEVIENLRNSGINAVPYPSAGLFGTEGFESGGDRVYPLAGISNRTTLMCNESGQWITYESDEHGFHNPLGIWGKVM